MSPVNDPRFVLCSALDAKQQKDYEQFETMVLEHHVKPREGRAGNTYILDKRNALLGNGKRETLRSPDDPRWPEGGRTTTVDAIAKQWAKSHYIPMLWQTRQAAAIHPDADHLTWAEGAKKLVERYEVKKRDRRGREVRSIPEKHRSRVSLIRQHVLPAFGTMLMAGTTRTLVREEAEALRVTRVRRDGSERKRAAKHGTRLNFVRAMTAIWKHNFPDVKPPFEGVVVRRDADHDDELPTTVYTEENLQDALRAAEQKGGLSPDEVRLALTGAMHRDQELIRRPNIARGSMVPNTAHLFAALVALGVRISEARKIRWSDIHFQGGYVIVHQVKLHTNKRAKPKPTLRIVPLQDSLLPWLEELRQLEGIVDPTNDKSYVFRTSRHGAAKEPAAQNTLVARATKALRYAGVKPEGYATHWGRATHASWGALAEKVKAEELRHFLGHAAFGGTTERYVTQMKALLRPEHRAYIALPTPAQVRAEMAAFRPNTLDWRAWRTFQSRSQVEKEARRQRRLDRQSLGTTLQRRPVKTIR